MTGFAGITFHAAIALLDQQSPHNCSGTTRTSAGLRHPRHGAAGERSSTSPTAFIKRINRRTDMAEATVFRFHTAADITFRMLASLL
jgi:hypothetical protein